MSDDVQEHQGQAIIIRFDPRRCARAGACVRRCPDVFQAAPGGLRIVPDAAPPEAVEAAVIACRSGALRCERREPASAAPEGLPKSARRARCYCGVSKAMPYCDGSHALPGVRLGGAPSTAEVQGSEIRILGGRERKG